MTLRVHHYFPLGSGNIGDHMVARAIQTQVPRFFGGCEFVEVPVNDRYSGGDREVGLRGENLARTNAEADLVIIGGSNLLEPRKPRRNAETGVRGGRWSVFTDLASIEALTVPVMLVGMGTGSSFGRRIRPYREPAMGEVRALFGKAFAHSVRDVTTVRKLAEIGVSTRCTGCPVTFLENHPVAAQAKELPLAVSLPPFYIGDSFLGRMFLRGTVEYLRWLSAEKIPTLVTLHEDRDVTWAKENLPADLEVFYTEDRDEQLARLRRTRGMIGFRLHAALTALALGKPVIPVGIDHRGLGFIDTFDAAEYSVRSLRPFQFAKLRTLTKRLLANDPALIAHLNTAKARLMTQHDAFLAEAAAKFGGLRR